MVENNKKTAKGSSENHDPSRRKFIKNTGLATGGVVGGTILGALLGNPFKSEEAPKEGNADKPFTETRMFFTRFEDFNVLSQATERIYPEDDNGPGAIGLGVPFFIDKQLAGAYGVNKNDYMKGPGQKVEGINTYQTLMNRGDVFIEGVRKMNKESQDRFDARFYDLEGEQQDEILQDLIDEKIKLVGVSSSTFFNLLRDMTIEGAYADPLYGGNKDMQGWKMKEHPGIRASYIDLIESEDFELLDPISLRDYQQ